VGFDYSSGEELIITLIKNIALFIANAVKQECYKEVAFTELKDVFFGRLATSLIRVSHTNALLNPGNHLRPHLYRSISRTHYSSMPIIF
jgi:hypothetical protein